MNFSAITYPDVNNGSGCRVTFWVSGCPHHCSGCHNPETWDENFGKKFTVNVRNQLINLLSPCYIKGLTISGGEPLYKNNIEDVFNLISKVKNVLPEKDIWLYTGYKIEELLTHDNLQKHILKYIDVLVDGRFVNSLKDSSLAFRGSSNQRIIDVQKTLDINKIVILNL